MPKGMGRQYSGAMQRRFVLRIREIEDDARTERSYDYLLSENAERAAVRAKDYGYFTRIIPVIGRERPPHRLADGEQLVAPEDASELQESAEV